MIPGRQSAAMHRLEAAIRIKMLHLLSGRLIQQLQEREIPRLRRLVMRISVIVIRGRQGGRPQIIKRVGVVLPLVQDRRDVVSCTRIGVRLVIVFH